LPGSFPVVSARLRPPAGRVECANGGAYEPATARADGARRGAERGRNEAESEKAAALKFCEVKRKMCISERQRIAL
jgi:hypothetical protein